jgi:DNA repair exonuclease SbcCD ATPase subunit
LFGLSDYETAWSNIGPFQRDYDNEKRILENDPDVKGIEKLSAEYNRASEEYTLLEMDLQDLTDKLAVSKRILEEADKKLKQVEEKKLAHEELKRKEVKVRTNCTNLQETLAALTQRAEDKKTVIGNLQQRQMSFEAQTKLCLTKLEQVGLPTNLPIEELRAYLASFDDKISTLKGDMEATSRDFSTDQKRAVTLKTENKCPLCVQPLDGQYKSSLMDRIVTENYEREKIMKRLQVEIEGLKKNKVTASEAYSNLQNYGTKCEYVKNQLLEEEANLKSITGEFEQKQLLEVELAAQLKEVQNAVAGFEMSDVDNARQQREHTFKQYYLVDSDLRTKQNRKKDLQKRLNEINERIDHAQEKLERIEKTKRTVEVLMAVRDAYRSIQPKLRSEFVKVLRNFVQQILDSLVGAETPLMNISIDDTYTPYVKSDAGVDREVSNLSGGERTLLAFAYRMGLGQLIMQSRTGHGLSMLFLDEPTENLGSEDGSIERLAEAISKFKAIEQIVAVTHSEVFAAKAEHVIILEKEAGVSKVSLEK